MYKKILLKLFVVVSCFGLLNADKLEDIKSKGYMDAGVKYDFEPFGFIDEYGKVIGFDIDLLEYIAKDLGVTVKYHKVTSKNRIQKLEDNSVDIVAASMTHTQDRDKDIDFSISYFFDGQAILTTKYVKVNHHFGFNGKRVGVTKGSRAADTFKSKVIKAKILYFDNYDKAIDALYAGKIDAITTDMVWCKNQANKSNGKLRVLPKTISYEPYGIGVAQNESNLLDAINFSIQKAVNDGSYEKIYKKWFNESANQLPEVWPN